jgi:hypothetical protein
MQIPPLLAPAALDRDDIGEGAPLGTTCTACNTAYVDDITVRWRPTCPTTKRGSAAARDVT